MQDAIFSKGSDHSTGSSFLLFSSVSFDFLTCDCSVCSADHCSSHVVLKAGHTTQFVARLEQDIFSSPTTLLTHVDFMIIVNVNFLSVEMLLHQSFPRFCLCG